MVGTQRESLAGRTLFAKKHMPFLHLIGAGPEEWRKTWTGFYEESGGEMSLAFPATRAEVVGAEEAIPVVDTRVLAGVEARGAGVSLRLRPPVHLL